METLESHIIKTIRNWEECINRKKVAYIPIRDPENMFYYYTDGTYFGMVYHNIKLAGLDIVVPDHLGYIINHCCCNFQCSTVMTSHILDAINDNYSNTGIPDGYVILPRDLMKAYPDFVLPITNIQNLEAKHIENQYNKEFIDKKMDTLAFWEQYKDNYDYSHKYEEEGDEDEQSEESSRGDSSGENTGDGQ